MTKFDVRAAVTNAKNWPKLDGSESHPVGLDVPMVNGQRRRLTVPSPAAYSQLCLVVGENWKEVSRLLDMSPVTLSRPVLNRNAGGRALVDRFTASQQRRIRMERSRRAAVTLYMDVSNFYNSIYTHAVDWAVRTKPIAKRNRSRTTLGEMLDDRLQSANDRQTSGIAIGPDASRVISEIVMSRIDNDLITRFPRARNCMVRYIDDVTLYAESYEQAQEISHEYERLLGNYELALNGSKTRVDHHVVPADPRWRYSLGQLIARARRAEKVEGMVSVLSNLLEEVNTQEDPGLLRYFLSAFPQSSLNSGTWGVLQDFMTMALRIDGMTVGHLHRLALYAHRKGLFVEYRDFEANMHDYLDEKISRGNSYEVASVINLLTDLGRPIDTEHALSALALENDFVDLLILEAATKVKRLKRVATKIGGYGSEPSAFGDGRWLLAYEVQRRDSTLRTNEFTKGNWVQLADAGVRFLREPSSSPESRWYLSRLARRAKPSTYAER